MEETQTFFFFGLGGTHMHISIINLGILTRESKEIDLWSEDEKTTLLVSLMSHYDVT